MDVVAGVGIAVGFLVGLIGHEVVQHRVAVAMGDRTPKLMGRLRLSPKAHLDPIGTAILPGIFTLAYLFTNPLTPILGWGKRHAITAAGFRDHRKGVLISSLSGPATNAVIAAVLGRVAVTLGPGSDVGRALRYAALVNIFLMVWEILPIPGRDGARVLALFLSPAGASKIEELAQYEIIFMIIIWWILGGVITNMAGVACPPIAGFTGFPC